MDRVVLRDLSNAFESLATSQWAASSPTKPAPAVISRPTQSPAPSPSTPASKRAPLSTFPYTSSGSSIMKSWPLACSPVRMQDFDSSPLSHESLASSNDCQAGGLHVARHPLSALAQNFNFRNIHRPDEHSIPCPPRRNFPIVVDGVKIENHGTKLPVISKNADSSRAALSPIENCAVPAVASGNNVVVCVQDEDIAFKSILAPVLSRIRTTRNPRQQSPHVNAPLGRLPNIGITNRLQMSQPGSHRIRISNRASPSILVLVPTKEVANRVFERTQTLCNQIAGDMLRLVLVRGAEDTRPQLRALGRGCDVLVSTTGRLMDFLERGSISLKHVEVLVLWEAGHMSNIGLQMKLRRIAQFEGMTDKHHQTVVFTKAFPRRLEVFCDNLMGEYVFVATDSTTSCVGIRQLVEFVNDDAHKRQALLSAFRLRSNSGKNGSRVLVFVATKRTADSLAKWLTTEGITVRGLHGGRSQEDREESLQMFNNGSLPVLVSTDVANHVFERLPQVELVVNYDMPTNIEAYIRRTGQAGVDGSCIAFISEICLPILPDLAAVLHQCKQNVPSWFTEMCDQAQAENDSLPQKLLARLPFAL